jgi:ribosome assembly protein 3
MASDGTPKRKRKRKVRTEGKLLSTGFSPYYSLWTIALSPSGDGKEEKSRGNDTQSLNVGNRSVDSQEKAAKSQEKLHETRGVGGFDHSLGPEPESSRNSKRDFASFYLRRITEELADELDKIRSANDFSEGSLPILIHALQQGQSIFSEQEKRRVMGET